MEYKISSLVPRPSPSLSSLTVRKSEGGPGIMYHMRDVRIENLIERVCVCVCVCYLNLELLHNDL